jgi:hypothetical protein
MPGDKLVLEDDDLKDFFLVTQGTLQHAPAGEATNINVGKVFDRVRRR